VAIGSNLDFEALSRASDGAVLLTRSMGCIGIPRYLAEPIATLRLKQVHVIAVLMALPLVAGGFLHGISMVVSTTRAGESIAGESRRRCTVVRDLHRKVGAPLTRPGFVLMIPEVVLIFVFPKIVAFLVRQVL